MSIITHPTAHTAQTPPARQPCEIRPPEVTQAERNDLLGLALAVGITVRVRTR